MSPLFRAIVKFCSTNRLFTYFRRRYSKRQIGDLNSIVKLRGKIRTAKFSISFYKLCLANGISSKFISARISISCARHSPTIERAFLNDEIENINAQIWHTERAYEREWIKIRNFLSFFDLIRFCLYLSEIDQRTENAINKKRNRNIQLLRKKRFGGMFSDKVTHSKPFGVFSLWYRKIRFE